MITTGTFPKALEGGKMAKKQMEKMGKKNGGKTPKAPPPAGKVSPRKQMAMGGKCPK
jgi:hypothetical protein